MNPQTPIEYGNYYHIYNRGNNGCNLFYNNKNYFHFLRLYEKYINPIADTFAWVLLGNHFHLLIRIKDEEIINSKRVLDPFGVENKIKPPINCFSNLFNSYAQAINKAVGRTGSLFEHPFRRKVVTSEEYFRNLIIYIHQNPQKHGFIDNFKDYPWSSYGTMISDKPTLLNRNKVIEWFDGIDNLTSVHEQDHDYSDSEWVIE